MNRSRLVSCTAFVATLACAVLWHGTAPAQFTRLPEDDFTWRWGDQRGSRIDDFSIRGGQDRFFCTLTGELRAGTRFSLGDLRTLQSQLRQSLWFIEEAVNTMNRLDRQRALAWAVLDCVEQGGDDEE